MPLFGPAPATTADNFGDRSIKLISFMMERQSQTASVRQCEHEVCDWIDGWRRREMRCAGAQQHFASTELGIILRVLNGPSPTGPKFEDSANQQLCWLLARCLSQQV
jgi:hypothetical protein